MRIVWLALAVGLVVGAQLLKVAGILLSLPLWLNIGAVLILAWQLRAAQSEIVEAVVAPRPDDAQRRRGARLIDVGTLAAIGCSLWLFHDWRGAVLPVLVIGPLALLALARGLDIAFGYGDRWRVPWRRLRAALRRRDVQLLLAIVMVGVLFRFRSIGDFPPVDGFSSIEETQRGTGGHNILELGARPWEWPLAQYLAAASFAVFGYSIHALRVPVMLMGCVTLLPFYLLVRELTGAPAALCATALLAVARWHVQVSWYNEDVYVPLLPFVVVLWLLVRTRRDPRPAFYVVVGAGTGYMLFDYAGFRVTPVVVLAFFLGELWHRRSRPRDWRQWMVAAAVFGLFLLPLFGIVSRIGTSGYLEAIHRAFANTGYYTHDSRSFVAQRWRRVGLAADMFTATDHTAFLESLNTRGEALLDPVTSVLFVVGFGLALVQPRRHQRAFFALTFLALTAGATVLVPNLDFRRLSILVPFVFVFVALGADGLAHAATQLGFRRAAHGALALVVVAAGIYNYHFLFQVLAPNRIVRTFHRDHYTVPAFYLKRHYHGEAVVLLSPFTQNFFAGNDYDWIKPHGLRGLVAEDEAHLFTLLSITSADHGILVLLERPPHFDVEGLQTAVRAAYPGATCELRRDPDDRRWDLGVCRIPAPGQPTPPSPVRAEGQ